MASNRGGARPGAGRKSNVQIEKVRSMVAEVVTDENWRTIIERLFVRAQYGDHRSISLLLALRFGVSADSAVNGADDTSDTEPVANN